MFEKKLYKEAARERQRKCREKKRLACEQNLNNAPESRPSQASVPQADRPTENLNQICLTSSNRSPRSFKTPQSL